jgi:hypothetical protein
MTESRVPRWREMRGDGAVREERDDGRDADEQREARRDMADAEGHAVNCGLLVASRRSPVSTSGESPIYRVRVRLWVLKTVC